MKRIDVIARGLLIVATLFCSESYAASIELVPNGTGDDTAQLQKALLSCTHPSEPCDLRLSAGVFYTDVLLVKGFNGAITGRGQDRTIIRPLAHRALRSTAKPFADEPTLAQPYPVLLHFANDSKVSLSGFTLDFPADMTVMPYDFYLIGPNGTGITTSLISAILVDGTRNAELDMRQVTIIGKDNDSFYGSNLFNAVRFEGQLRPTGRVDRTRKLQHGRFVADGIVTQRTGNGISIESTNNTDGRVVNNEMDARIYAVLFTDLGASTLTAEYNNIRAELTGIFVTQTPERPPATPSDYVIAQNRISVNENNLALDPTGGYDAIAVYDFAAQTLPITGRTIAANVNISDNDITLGENIVSEGILVFSDGPGDVRVLGNRIRGTPYDSGIHVDLSYGTFIAGNDLSAIDPVMGDVHLGKNARGCRVIEPGDSVDDEGGHNKVIM